AELARALGAEPVRTDRAGLPATVQNCADAVIECSGDPAAPQTALRMAAPGGRVCLYSVYPGPSQVDLNQVAEFKELTLVGGHLAPGCFPEAVGLLSTVPADLVVTAVRPLSDYSAALDEPTGPRVKEVLVP
ncbi:MAG: zinc-binding dehydrogenase, partial [Actinocatenispora sp.]